jgi:hypothetical protein
MMRGPTRAWRDGADVDAGQVTFRRAIGTGSERPLGKHVPTQVRYVGEVAEPGGARDVRAFAMRSGLMPVYVYGTTAPIDNHVPELWVSGDRSHAN